MMKGMQKYTTLDEFLSDLDTDKRLQVDMLRDLILETNNHLQEHLKWNAPSYVLDGEDRITFNLMNKQGIVKVVLHMGATRSEDKKGKPVMHDESGLIVWSSDIRGVLSFDSLHDINTKVPLIRAIFRDWLAVPLKNK